MLSPGGKLASERGWLQPHLGEVDWGCLLMVITPWGQRGRHHHQEGSKHMKQTQETDLHIWVSLTDHQHWKTLRAPLSPGREIFSHVVDISTQPWAGSWLDDSALIQSSTSNCLTWLEGE